MSLNLPADPSPSQVAYSIQKAAFDNLLEQLTFLRSTEFGLGHDVARHGFGPAEAVGRANALLVQITTDLRKAGR